MFILFPLHHHLCTYTINFNLCYTLLYLKDSRGVILKNNMLPKYIQAKDEILRWILTGKYQKHDKLPSENEIVQHFQMSRQTIRQALGELEKEGWLYKEQGKGTFVMIPDAQQPRSHSTAMTIGLITTYISDYIFPTIVRGVEAKVREHGARLLLASTDNEKNKEKDSLESMMHEKLDGLIIEPTKSAEGNPNLHYFLALEAHHIPYVMLNERYNELDAPVLRVDDEQGGYIAAKHLIELGHRRIAGFFKTDDLQGVYRMKGFMRALKEHQLTLTPNLLLAYDTEQKRDKPKEKLASLLALNEEERPTALVCYNDELAVQVLEVTRQFDVHVPGQLSIVGFDDATIATATEVKLTTLTHPKTKMGEDAVDILQQLISGISPSQLSKVYVPELVIRESTTKCTY